MKKFSINFDHIKRLMLVLSARNHVIICKDNKMFEKKTVIFIEQYMQYKIKKQTNPFSEVLPIKIQYAIIIKY